jgi:hypothetical protein
METFMLAGGGSWLEPAVGYGHIVRAVDDWHMENSLVAVTWHTNDILTTPHAQTNYDVCEHVFDRQYDVVITNPPFSRAEAFFRALYPIARRALALLLPISWLGTPARADQHRRYAPTLYVLPERPRFRSGSNTDQEAYAWFVWNTNIALEHRRHKYVILPETPLEERRESEKRAWEQMPAGMQQERNEWVRVKKEKQPWVFVRDAGQRHDEKVKRRVSAVAKDRVKVMIQPKFFVTIALDDGRQTHPTRGMQFCVPRQHLGFLRKHAEELFEAAQEKAT